MIVTVKWNAPLPQYTIFCLRSDLPVKRGEAGDYEKLSTAQSLINVAGWHGIFKDKNAVTCNQEELFIPVEEGVSQYAFFKSFEDAGLSMARVLPCLRSASQPQRSCPPLHPRPMRLFCSLPVCGRRLGGPQHSRRL